MQQDLINLSKEDIAGTYFNTNLMASGLRLTLVADGHARLEKWLDLGAKWMLLGTGEFALIGTIILTTFRDVDWCETSFATDGELHVRRLHLRRDFDEPELEWRYVLAPSDSVEELDRAVQENQPELDRLEHSFFAARLFIQEASHGV